MKNSKNNNFNNLIIKKKFDENDWEITVLHIQYTCT